MTSILIVNNPSELKKSKASKAQHYAILGINPFLNELILPNVSVKNLSIFLQGSPEAFINHILWNQYYNNTLLRQFYHFVNEGRESPCFLKINERTYKLIQCLKWENSKRFSEDIKRCGAFAIEGFTEDGNLKKVYITLGESPIYSYDIIFQYSGTSSNKIKRKISWNQSLNLNSAKKNNTSNKQNVTKKKTDRKKKQLGRDFVYSVNSTTKTKSDTFKSNKKPIYESTSIEPIERLSIQNPVYSVNDFNKSASVNFHKKQLVIGELLKQKQNKVKLMEKIIKDEQQKYSEQLELHEQNHRVQIEDLKGEVEEILNKYKKKAKQCKKQNQCLTELNAKLMKTIQKNENRIAEMEKEKIILCEEKCQIQEMAQANLSFIKQEKDEKITTLSKLNEELQKQATENSEKLDALTVENIQIKSKYLEDKKNFAANMKQKQNKIQDYKRKYEKLLSSMRKLVNYSEMNDPLSCKQNI